MRNRFKQIITVILSVILMGSLAACTVDDNGGGGAPEVTILLIRNSGIADGKLSMFAGNATTLEATVNPKGTTVTWTSSNDGVATVTKTNDTKATLAGVDGGSTTITLKAGNKEATLAVTVKDSVLVETLSFTAEKYDIVAQNNDNVSLSMLQYLKFNPTDVTDKLVNWKVEPIDGAKADDVTIDATGTATVIKEKAVEGSKYRVTATSINQADKSAIAVLEVKHTKAESLTVRWGHNPGPDPNNSYTFPLSYRRYEGLNFVAEPQPLGAMDKFTFTSNNPSVVSITTSAKGIYGSFKIESIGSAQITAQSTSNAAVVQKINITVTETPANGEFVVVDDSRPEFNLNLTASDLSGLTTDTRTSWNFDPEGETYKTDRAASVKNWKNFTKPGLTPPLEMANSGNGQSIFDGGYAMALDSWDWPQDNEQTNLFMYNKINIPNSNEHNIFKMRIRTQKEGGATGKGKFRIRLVDPNTYKSTFLKKDALLTVSDFAKPDDRPAADIGTQDPNSHWITLNTVPDFTIGMDWFHFTIPQDLKGKDMIMIFEVDDMHTNEDLGTDGCDRVMFSAIYFASNSNPDPNTLRTKG